jgi:hypothetical protein
MADLTVGYEEEGFGGADVHTTLPMQPELREALDERILEGRIVPQFDEVEVFRPFVDRILEALPHP